MLNEDSVLVVAQETIGVLFSTITVFVGLVSHFPGTAKKENSGSAAFGDLETLKWIFPNNILVSVNFIDFA